MYGDLLEKNKELEERLKESRALFFELLKSGQDPENITLIKNQVSKNDTTIKNN